MAERIIRPRLRRAFPQLEPQPFTRLWGGRFLLTGTGAPSLVRLGQGGYAAVGCNGFGHTLAISAAQELARLALGESEEALALPVCDARPGVANGLIGALLAHGMAPLANRLGA
jgi:glycine/D-amino acid oxidase-like deaminating enzyme